MKTKPFRVGATVLLVTIVMAALGCGGDSPSAPNPGPGPTPAALTITPQTDTLGPRGTRTFASTRAVTWTLLEGATGGTITDAGAYTAPATLGTYHVVATSVADQTKTATATVQVVKSGFTVTGTITKARLGHTATVLSNGKVLIAGGGWGPDFGDGLITIPEAELFDPSTGTSTIAGTTTRTYATATLLANGKVLMTGGEYFVGQGSWIVHQTAEIYNPTTGQFEPVGNMGTTREYHAATLLANGRVLVSGGWNGTALSAAEIYDPASGTFASTGSMATPRYSHTSTLLTNGKVLVTGGNDYGASGSSTSAEVYDPLTGMFTPTGSMGEARPGHTATLLSNGNVLVTGGGLNGGTAEVYDPSTGRFTPAGHIGSPRRSLHTATLLPDGTVLIAGGITDNNSATYTAEIYDPATGSFVPTGSLAEAQFGHTATALADGSVLLLGGSTDGVVFTPVSSAEVYK